MAIISAMHHDISGFRLENYHPENSHAITLHWNIDGSAKHTVTLFFLSGTEALKIARALADEFSTVYLKHTGATLLLPWLAERDAAEAIEAERARAGEEELEELEEAEEGSADSNSANSWDGVSDDGN